MQNNQYIRYAGLTSGPQFPPRRASASEKLADRSMGEVTMYRLILGYLERLPGVMKEITGKDGTTTVVAARLRRF
jgi:hypothetical protein